MAAFSNYLELGLLNSILRNASGVKPASVYVSLHTASPTDAGTPATELSDSGYSRVECQGDTNWTAPSAQGGGSSTSNANTLEFDAIVDGPVTVSHFGVYDAATGGNLLFHGEMDTPRSLQINDVVSVPAGALTIVLE